MQAGNELIISLYPIVPWAPLLIAVMFGSLGVPIFFYHWDRFTYSKSATRFAKIGYLIGTATFLSVLALGASIISLSITSL